MRLLVRGPIATVVLTRPERLNAQTPRTWQSLRDIGERLTERIRVVVVRAEGRAFSAGLDRALLSTEGLPGQPGIGQLAGAAGAADTVADTEAAADTDAAADAVIRGYQGGFTWLRRPQFVSVAAVQGHAVGAGFQLALACDLRILTDDAQLCMAETSLGIVPDLAGSKPLVDAVGYARALEICATGRRVGAAEALAWGLANLVVPRPELESATADLVAALLEAPAGAVAETKALLQGAGNRSHADQEALERAAQLRRLRDLFPG